MIVLLEKREEIAVFFFSSNKGLQSSSLRLQVQPPPIRGLDSKACM